MPNFASRYQSGTLYWEREFQSGRKGPSSMPRSTSARIALRGPSYFAVAFCQTPAKDSALFEAVGAVLDCAMARERGKVVTAAASKQSALIDGCPNMSQVRLSWRGRQGSDALAYWFIADAV